MAAVGAFPGGEPLQAAAEHAVEGGLAVADHGEGVVLEHLRDVVEVVLELVEGGLYGGVGIEPVLELEEHQRQAVDEQQQIGAALVLAFYRELVHHQELVLREVVIINRVKVAEVAVPVVVFPGFAEAFAELEVEGVVALVHVGAGVEEELLLHLGQHLGG